MSGGGPFFSSNIILEKTRYFLKEHSSQRGFHVCGQFARRVCGGRARKDSTREVESAKPEQFGCEIQRIVCLVGRRIQFRKIS